MKRLVSVFLVLLILVSLPITAFAADSITVSASKTTAAVGDEITLTGTATADTWISLKGSDAGGSIVYFSAVLSDASGSYSQTFKVPEMADGTLTVIAGSASMTASAAVTVYTPASGDNGDSDDSDDSGTSQIESSRVKITFDSVAQAAINKQTNGTYTVKAVKISVQSLSDEAKALIGSRPAYELSVTSGSTTISDFGGGKANVSIPYTLVDGEDENAVVVYYVTATGVLVAVPNCVYDAESSTVTFTTTHFSTYAVGYNPVSFSDVSDSAWYADYVSFLAARGIVGGNNGTFSPDASITRAEFVTILARMSGDDLSGYMSSTFTDVAASNWYFGAVQWAYKNGVASGYGGKFNPNASITRQDIAVMLVRYADKVASYTLQKTNSAVTFTDSAKISSYASDAVTTMQQAGIISGNSDGSFAPTANATRAEAAKMIAVPLQSMV